MKLGGTRHYEVTGGKSEIKWGNVLYYEYPDGTWWMAEIDSRYGVLFNDYISQIREEGEAFGVYLQE
jgi:hypothetical protein